jgi:hypothetical protein
MVPNCRGRLRQLLEVPIEARAQLTTPCTIGAGTRQDYEVPGRQGALVTEGFASETLELIAVHGSPRGSA